MAIRVAAIAFLFPCYVGFMVLEDDGQATFELEGQEVQIFETEAGVEFDGDAPNDDLEDEDENNVEELKVVYGLPSSGYALQPADSEEERSSKSMFVGAVCTITSVASKFLQVMAPADENGDGVLDLDELKKYFNSVRGKELMKETFGSMDADEDGEDELDVGVVDEDIIGGMLNAMTKPFLDSFCPTLDEDHCGALGDVVEKLIDKEFPDEMMKLCDGIEQVSNDETDLDEGPEDDVDEELSSGEYLEVDASASMIEHGGVLQEVATRRTAIQADELAWAVGTQSIAKLMASEACRKDVWARSANGMICKSGWYQGGSGLDAGLCYRHCPSGYGRFGDHCWEHCPSGWEDVGATCTRMHNRCHRVCVDYFFGKRCENVCHPEPQIHTKNVQHKPGCSITSTSCATCRSGHSRCGALCYQNPPSGYRCVGCAALTCYRDCNGYLGTDCGDSCSVDTGSCVQHIASQVNSVLEAAISTATTVMTFGAGSLATKTLAMSQASLNAAARQGARRAAIRISREQFKKNYKKVVKDEVKRVIKEAIQENLVDAAQEQALQLSAEASSDSLFDTIKNAQGTDGAMQVLRTIDPTGILAAIDSSKDGSTGMQQAGAWMDVVGIADPTGILSCVASFLKTAYCEATMNEMSASVEPPNNCIWRGTCQTKHETKCEDVSGWREMSEQECKDYASDFGLTWERTGSWDRDGRWCIRSGNRVYYNTNAAATATHPTWSNSVCLKGYRTLFERRCEEVSGWRKMSEQECKDYASDFGLTWERTGTWDRDGRWCIRSGNRVYYNTNAAATATHPTWSNSVCLKA